MVCLAGSAVSAHAQDDPVSVLKESIRVSRDVAADLRQQVSHCRAFLASNPPGSTCTPGYKNCNGDGVHVSIAQAETVASVLENHAVVLQGRLPELERRQNKVVSDQNAIRNLGFTTTADQLMAWKELSEGGRRELKNASLSAILDSAFLTAGKLVSVHYDPKAAGEIVKELQSPLTAKALAAMGVSAKDLIDLVVKLNKPSATKLTGQLLELLISKLSKIKSVLALGSADPSVVGLKVLKMFLGWMIKSPALKFLLIELEWATSAVYNFAAQWISSYHINKLTELTEVELKTLKRLHEMLKTDVDALLLEIKTLPSCPNV